MNPGKRPHHGLAVSSPCFQLVTLLVAIAFSLLLSACGQVSFTTEEHIERGLTFLEEGDVAAASIEFRNALQQDPSSAEGRFHLGMLMLRVGDVTAAENELARAREQGWDADQLRLPMLRVALLQAQYGRILEETRLAESFPRAQVPEALALRGLALLGAGNPTEAEEVFADVLAQHPETVEAQIGMGIVVLAYERDPAAARVWIQKALDTDPHSTRAWELLGDLERSQGRFAPADEAYSEAIRNSHAPYAIHLKRALARVSQDDLTGAEEDHRAMRRLGRQHPATSFVEGLLHFRSDRYSEAQVSMEEALQRARDLHSALLILGASLIAQEQWQQADHYLRRYLTVRPDSDEAARLLALVRLRDGDLGRAEELLKPVLIRAPEDVQTLNMLGGIHLARGERAESIAYLRRVAAQRPEDTLVRTTLGRELLRAGEIDEALGELDSIIGQTPEAHELEVELIIDLIRQRRFDLAIEAAERLSSKVPELALPHNLKAAAYLSKGDFERAVDASREALELNPGDPSASSVLAQVAMQRGALDEARQFFEGSRQLHPRHVGVIMRMAQLDAMRGDEASMVALLKEAIDLQPEAVAPRFALARYYLGQGEPLRTIGLLEPLPPQAFETDLLLLDLMARAQVAAGQNDRAARSLRALAVRVSDTADVRFRLGTGFAQIGQGNDASNQLRRALRLDPGHLGAMRLLAAIEVEQGRPEEALDLARRMQATAPERADGYGLEGRLLLDMGRDDAAVEALRKAAQLADTQELTMTLALAFQGSGQFPEAADVLRTRLDRHPHEDEVRQQLAHTLLQIGDHKDAIREYERLAETYPSNAALLNNLAYLYQVQGDPRALETAERALEFDPDNPSIADTLGWILVQRGQLDRGLTLLRQARSALPERADVRYHYAVALAEKGHAEEARRELESLLSDVAVFAQREQARALLDHLP